MTTSIDKTTFFQEKRRVRSFLISPLQLLRCFQLLAAGVKLEAEVFPPGVVLLYSEDTQLDGQNVFLLMLEHNSFDPIDVTHQGARLMPVKDHIPPIIFQLNELQDTLTPLPVLMSEAAVTVAGCGKQVEHGQRYVRVFEVLPYQILRLFSLLAAGLAPVAPPFPTGMTLLHSGYSADKSIFFMVCEHPAFDINDVDIERVDGHITATGVRGMPSRLEINEEATEEG